MRSYDDDSLPERHGESVSKAKCIEVSLARVFSLALKIEEKSLSKTATFLTLAI